MNIVNRITGFIAFFCLIASTLHAQNRERESYKPAPILTKLNDTLEIRMIIDNLTQGILQDDDGRFETSFARQNGKLDGKSRPSLRQISNKQSKPIAGSKFNTLTDSLKKASEQTENGDDGVPVFRMREKTIAIRNSNEAEIDLEVEIRPNVKKTTKLNFRRENGLWRISDTQGLEPALNDFFERKERHVRKRSETLSTLSVSSTFTTITNFINKAVLYQIPMDNDGRWSYNRSLSNQHIGPEVIAVNTDSDGLLFRQDFVLVTTDPGYGRIIYWIKSNNGGNEYHAIKVYGAHDTTLLYAGLPSRIAIRNEREIYVIDGGSNRILLLSYESSSKTMKHNSLGLPSEISGYFPEMWKEKFVDICIVSRGIGIIDASGNVWIYDFDGITYTFVAKLTSINVGGNILPIHARKIEASTHRIAILRETGQVCTFETSIPFAINTVNASITDFGTRNLTTIGVDCYGEFMVGENTQIHKLDWFGNYLASFSGFETLRSISNSKIGFNGGSTPLDIGTAEQWSDTRGFQRFVPGADAIINNLTGDLDYITVDWTATNAFQYVVFLEKFVSGNWQRLQQIVSGNGYGARRIDQIWRGYIGEHGSAQLRISAELRPMQYTSTSQVQTIYTRVFTTDEFGTRIPSPITTTRTYTGNLVASNNVSVENDATLSLSSAAVRVSNGSARFSVSGNSSIRITPNSRVFVGSGGSSAAPFEVLVGEPDSVKTLAATIADKPVNVDSLKRKQRADSLALLGKRELPKEYGLSQNYPNPFNPSTIISYQLPVTSEVSLVVYDVLGRVIQPLVNTRQAAGYYEASFNASQLASGVYFYRLQAGNFVSTKKMLLVK